MAGEGRVLVDGVAAGAVVVLDEPLSFWGGFDVRTGRVVGRHPQAGTDLAGCVLVMSTGRGSSSSSSVLAEAIAAGTAPAGIVLAEPDDVIALGAVVAGELYGTSMPVLVASPDLFAELSAAKEARIHAGGAVHVGPVRP